LKGLPPDRAVCGRLAREIHVPYLLSVLLWQRGITSGKEALDFLTPQLSDLPSPFLMKDMDAAATLAVRAIAEQWPVYIHGDYDVDGISATALLALFFKSLGISPVCYQPDRLTEGYGVQRDFLVRHAPGNSRNGLLITVDCGVSAVDEITLAREMGYTVIVTDHHEPPEILPPAHALVNPKQKGCPFPFQELAGVGVAFFLAAGIRGHLIKKGMLDKNNAPNLKQLMDLVALGTVADVMPVTGINRILIKAGLEVMNQRPSRWVAALQPVKRDDAGPIRAEDLSYRFAPRINAPGRLGKPELAFELLTCTSASRARELAETVESLNRERRQLEMQALDEVFRECALQQSRGTNGFIVYGDYHPGVIGIIASRVVDRYGKPVIIFTDDRTEQVVKGSGRSVGSINLYDVLRACGDSLITFGGHAMAAGMTVEKENLPFFAERFNYIVSQQKPEREAVTRIMADCRATPEEILDGEFLRYYSQLEPFGYGNPEPIFLLEEPKVSKPEVVKNHLRYRVESNGSYYHAIGFDLADRRGMFDSGSIRVAVKIRKTMYRGVKRTEFHTVDVFHGTNGPADKNLT
jgi:single-stranded-DNA-specific exonuclease